MGDYRQLGVFENLLANICFVKGDYTGAIDLCNKSIERDKNINNETNSSVNELLIGQCFFELGDYSEAETHFSIAQSLFDASDDKYYEYELLFYKIIIAILSNKIEASYNINQRFNTTTTKKTERIYTSIASKIIKNIYETQMRRMQIRMREPIRLPEVMTIEEVGRILADVRSCYGQDGRISHLLHVRNIAIIELLFASGIRVSELCNLRMRDVDLSAGRIRIIGKRDKERIVDICQ